MNKLTTAILAAAVIACLITIAGKAFASPVDESYTKEQVLQIINVALQKGYAEGIKAKVGACLWSS